jgi:hypothetical protein
MRLLPLHLLAYIITKRHKIMGVGAFPAHPATRPKKILIWSEAGGQQLSLLWFSGMGIHLFALAAASLPSGQWLSPSLALIFSALARKEQTFWDSMTACCIVSLALRTALIASTFLHVSTEYLRPHNINTRKFAIPSNCGGVYITCLQCQ